MDGGGGLFPAITRWLTPPIFFCVLNLMVITIFIRSSFKPKQNTSNKQEHHTQPPLITDENNPVHFFRFPSLLNKVKSFNFSRTYQRAEPEDEHAERFQHAGLNERYRHAGLNERYRHGEPEGRYQHGEPEERYQHAEPEDEHAQRYQHAKPSERYQHTEPEDEHAERYQHAEPVEEEKEPEVERQVARTMSDTMETVVKRQVVRGGVKKMRKSQSMNIIRVLEEEEEDEVEAVERERPATVRERKVTETVPFDEDEAKANDFINRFKQQLKLQRLESFLNYRGALK